MTEMENRVLEKYGVDIYRLDNEIALMESKLKILKDERAYKKGDIKRSGRR